MFSICGYEAYQNRINRGYEAYQNRINRGYEAYQNRINQRSKLSLFLFVVMEILQMRWINVNEKYLDFLREFEHRIPMTDYGTDKYKPFFGILFETDDYYYITQVSHAQKRHQKMRKQPDFFKIYDPKELTRLIAVINLNYMFPIPKNEVSIFEKKNIDTYRTFKSNQERSKYIALLDAEMKMINTLNLEKAATSLYEKKYLFPDSKLSQRCLDYKALENYAIKWNNTNE